MEDGPLPGCESSPRPMLAVVAERRSTCWCECDLCLHVGNR